MKTTVTLNKLREIDACITGIAKFNSLNVESIDLKELIKLAISKRKSEGRCSESVLNDLRDCMWLLTHYLKSKKNCIKYIIFIYKLLLPTWGKTYPEKNMELAIKLAENYLKNPSKRTKNAFCYVYTETWLSTLVTHENKKQVKINSPCNQPITSLTASITSWLYPYISNIPDTTQKKKEILKYGLSLIY